MATGDRSSSHEKSPVVLFIYNRLGTTMRVLDSILEYGPSKLYVIADGAHELKPEDEKKVASVRSYVDSKEYSFPVVREYATHNLGLAERFTSGLSKVFESEASAIILEDDCLPSQSFFHFCSQLLRDHEKDVSAGVISGNNFCQSRWPSEFDYEAALMPRTWGWATWARVWNEFDRTLPSFDIEQASKLGAELFSSKRIGRAWGKTVQNAIESQTIWDHQFAYWHISGGRVSLYPRVNLVKNIGFGVDATHTIFDSFTAQLEAGELVFPLHRPSDLVVSFDFLKLERAEKRDAWLRFALARPIDLIIRLTNYAVERSRRSINNGRA
jgi:hypothetical protein